MPRPTQPRPPRPTGQQAAQATRVLALLLLGAGCKGGTQVGSPPAASISLPLPAASAPALALPAPAPQAARPGPLLVGRCERLDAQGKITPGGAQPAALVEAAHRAHLALRKPRAAGVDGGLAAGKPFSYCQLSQDVLPGVTLVAATLVTYSDVLGDSSQHALLAVSGGQGQAVLLRHEGQGRLEQAEGRWGRLLSCPPTLVARAGSEPAECTDLAAAFERRAGELLAAPSLDRAAIENLALRLAAVQTGAPLARLLDPAEIDDRDLENAPEQPPLPPPSITPEGALLHVETSFDPLHTRSLITVRLEPSPERVRLVTRRVKEIPPPGTVPTSVKALVRVVSGEPESPAELQDTAPIVAAVRRCYQESLGARPGAAGSIELATRLDRSGRVGPPTSAVTGSLPPEVAGCAEKALAGRSFAVPRVAPLEFTVTLRLRTHEPWPDFPR